MHGGRIIAELCWIFIRPGKTCYELPVRGRMRQGETMQQRLTEWPIRRLAAALRDGQAKAEELIEAAIARHARYGETLHAYKHWDPERARAEARAVDALLAAGHDAGPLMGLPISIKDIYGVAGMPTFAGTPRELPAKWRQEGPVVRALRRQLAVVTGKTHTVELAFGGVGTNPHWGAVRNPWDAAAHRVCGGSSAGAGVSLAEGSAVLAMGSDTGGSVRIPASVTGTVGLKLTIGRWSARGIVPLSSTFDTPGPLTRTVEDSIVAFAVIDPAHDDAEALFARLDDLTPADLRLAICDEHFWDDCAPGIAEGVKAAVDELTAKGARLRRLSLPEAGDARERFLRAGLFGVEGLSFLEAEYPDRKETLDPNVWVRLEYAQTVSGVQYFSEMRKVRELATAADRRLRDVDVLVTPTVPITPPTVDEVASAEGYASANGLMTHNSQPINLLGLCAITLPVALDEAGLPVGMQLVARAGEEERLLAVALACEKTLGNARERLGRPPLTAA
jgi:aspartyl-tRNA(Asn)/glutamyl-tRNA(Gln) amidotransferase subunit A